MKHFKLINFIIFLFIIGCGYSPIYTSIDSKDFNINIISTKGSSEINNLLISKLEVYKDKKSDKNFNVNMISIYEKKILSKDEKGNATNYRLALDVKINTKINNENIELNYKETFDMKKQSDVFEEEKYEKLIINNMISSIVRKLTNKLNQLK